MLKSPDPEPQSDTLDIILGVLHAGAMILVALGFCLHAWRCWVDWMVSR